MLVKARIPLCFANSARSLQKLGTKSKHARQWSNSGPTLHAYRPSAGWLNAVAFKLAPGESDDDDGDDDDNGDNDDDDDDDDDNGDKDVIHVSGEFIVF